MNWLILCHYWISGSGRKMTIGTSDRWGKAYGTLSHRYVCLNLLSALDFLLSIVMLLLPRLEPLLHVIGFTDVVFHPTRWICYTLVYF